MTWQQIIGWLILISLACGLIYVCVDLLGWRMGIGTIIGACVVSSLVVLGIHLVMP